MKAIKTEGSKSEKKLMRYLLILISLNFFVSSRAAAQIDPSSAMLLNSQPVSATRESGIDSGRYTVRARGETAHRSDVTSASAVRKEAKPVAPAAESDETELVPAAAPVEAQGVAVKADSQQQPPRDDRRFAMLELSIAPGYLYNESKSTFSPRNYLLHAPAAGVDANVWVSSRFGIHTSYLGSINGTVTDSPDGTKSIAASNQWFTVGVQSRHFFGEGPRAAMLRLGIDYREFQFSVPSDSAFRNKLATSGAYIFFDTEFPTSGFGSWMLGAEFAPVLKHRESSAAAEFRTGDDPKTTSVGVHLGAHYRFDGTQSVFWKVSYGVERNLFSGTTSIPDPVTGTTQSNVSVTNTFSLFQIGYSWAN